MKLNQAAFDVLGGADEPAQAADDVELFERRAGGALPAAVREWYLLGGDRRLASISSNVITTTSDLTSRRSVAS